VLEDLKANVHTPLSIKMCRLLNIIQNCSGQVQGTKASLRYRRNDLKGYIIRFGVPQLFITINPADIHSPLMLFIAGEPINNVN
jgi:hypothetical protein